MACGRSAGRPSLFPFGVSVILKSDSDMTAEYILTSRKPRKNNRRELVNNPEDQLLGFDTVRETVFGMKKELNIDESINVKFDYEIIGGS